MEMLDGIDLESLVKTFGLVPPARAIHLLAQACESLAEAHAAGLIHRDVKPANIMACRKGQRFDFVKVLDFGLVRLGREQSRDQVSLTDAHLIGTPAFMAPEQALCRKDIDARADVYALGAVGFWLLTGTYVFESESTVAMLTDVIRSDPLPPSARGAQHLPEDLDALILSCLAKHPGERPESAAVLRERLLACDVAPWTEADAQAWWSERQPATGGADADATTLPARVPDWHNAPTEDG
jgi:serine/threonine-protein kinase